jgi:hypothetical protein
MSHFNDHGGGQTANKLNETTEISTLIESLEKLMNNSMNQQNPNHTAE